MRAKDINIILIAKHFMKFFFFFFLCVFVGSSSPRTNREEFITLYTEILSLEQRSLPYTSDSVRLALNKNEVRNILKKHQMDIAELNAFIDDINYNPYEWKEIFDSVSVRLQRLKEMERIPN
ncbi:MAG: hypothetical protein KGZ58_11190 [Ignavibacteriales bacterium]|nr:hypothetical protein [Ignavibacteriales bacterium]